MNCTTVAGLSSGGDSSRRSSSIRLASANAATSVAALSRPMPGTCFNSSTVASASALSEPYFCRRFSPIRTTFVPFNPVRSRMAINSAGERAPGPRATSRSRGRSLAGWSLRRKPSDMVIYDLRFTIYDCNSISAHEMEPSPQAKNPLTPAQRQAVAARGNVLVMAGAGTGKTHTLVERCLDCIIREGVSLDEILVVTFTEAAAAEMKQRLRAALEKTINHQPSTFNQFAAEQLALFDAAHIGTLHGFCFKLVREHFYELGLDPQPAVLDEGEARLLADETLEEALQEQYEGRDELAVSVQSLIQTYGGARNEKIRSLVLRLHHYAQTRPDAEGWLAGQIEKFSANEPADWQEWLLAAIADWRDEWLPVLENLKAGNEKAAELLGIVKRLGSAPAPGAVGDAPVADVRREGALNRTRGVRAPQFARELAADVLKQIVVADGNWPATRKGVLR